MQSNRLAAAVVTSINPPGAYVDEYLKLGIPLIVVADRKTPQWPDSYLYTPDIHFLSLDRQMDLFPELSEALGNDTYARKNIGYLFAHKLGVDVIIDSDDDTVPIRNPINEVETRNPVLEARSSNFMWNPYTFFAENEFIHLRIWPRGYPLSLVEASEEAKVVVSPVKDDSTRADTYQFLISGNPDVDALQRLVRTDFTVRPRYNKNFIRLEEQTWSPGNTQASIWTRPESFKYLYIPSTVTMRFCDILRMYVAQSNISMLFGGFLFNQVRNYHSLYQDFQDEIELRTQVELLYEILVTPNLRNLGILETYLFLERHGVIETEEITLLETFLKTLEE